MHAQQEQVFCKIVDYFWQVVQLHVQVHMLVVAADGLSHLCKASDKFETLDCAPKVLQVSHSFSPNTRWPNASNTNVMALSRSLFMSSTTMVVSFVESGFARFGMVKVIVYFQ